jgi:putative membrane protein
MMSFLIQWAITGIAVLVAVKIVPGIEIDDMGSAIIAALVLGLLNAFVRPLLVLLTLPVTFLTLGLFLLVINAVVLMFAAGLVSGFRVGGFGAALLGSIVISVVSWGIGALID